MSQNVQSPQGSEEVDLGQLFKMIGNLFDRFYLFVKSIFLYFFSILIFSIKAVIDNFKTIVVSMLVAGILGYAFQKTRKDVFESKMIVKPYFDSKYQLITNIGYYNALIGNKDYKQLSGLFQIDPDESANLVGFEINPGPESENDRILQYEKFLNSIDSTRGGDISFDKFLENRSLYSGSTYEITVRSFSRDIFKFLEKGFNRTFENEYSIKKMKKRDSLISIRKSQILNSLNQVDSLQKVYINVLQNESESSNNRFTVKDGISLVQERLQTREYELLDKELSLRQELASLESSKVEEDVYFDTLTGFQQIGSKYTSIWSKYVFIFPILTFVLLIVLFLTIRLVHFVKFYKE